MVAVFSYQLPALDQNFAEAGLSYQTVTNYTTLITQAEQKQLINQAQLASLHQWREDPQAWSDQH